MRVFEYKCNACGYTFEKEFTVEEINENKHHHVVCPKCGSADVRRIYSPPSLRFIGSGFYVNDYGKNT